MSDLFRTLSEPLRRDMRRFSGDVVKLAQARWELAQLEIAASRRFAQGLAIAAAMAGLLLAVGLTLAGVALSDLLAERTIWTPTTWRFILAGVLIALSLSLAAIGWLRFRRHFVGLAETMEEFREDAIWLREWATTLGAATSGLDDERDDDGADD